MASRQVNERRSPAPPSSPPASPIRCRPFAKWVCGRAGRGDGHGRASNRHAGTAWSERCAPHASSPSWIIQKRPSV